MFELTERHIKEGLSEQDFSDYAGYRVAAFKLDELPHWQKVLTGDVSKAEVEERAEALYRGLSARHLTMSANGDELFSWHEVWPAANQSTPSANQLRDPENPEKNSPSYFKNMGRQGSGFTQFILSGLTEFDHAPLPGAWCENIAVKKIYKSYAAFVLQSPRHEPAKDFWRAWTYLPDRYVTHYPDEDLHKLVTDLHEARHLRQHVVRYPKPFIFDFYAEGDADMFVSANFRHAGIGSETSKALRHSRYLNLMTSGPSFWFAPAFDAFENGQKPQDAFSVYRAVMEIRARLAMESDGTPHRQLSSQDMQNSIAEWDDLTTMILQKSDANDPRSLYHPAIKLHFSEPERLYQPLRQMVEQNVFTDPFAAQIARKILGAVEYFSPGLTQPERSIGLIKPPDNKLAH